MTEFEQCSKYVGVQGVFMGILAYFFQRIGILQVVQEDF